MSVDVDEVFPLLLGDAADVQAIAGKRLFPNRVPQVEDLPAVIWRRISGGAAGSKLNGRCLVRRASFQIESWSDESQEQARDLDLAVQVQLDGLHGRAIGGWWIQVMRLNPDTDQDNPQIPVHADDLGLFCSWSEFFVVYEPA